MKEKELRIIKRIKILLGLAKFLLLLNLQVNKSGFGKSSEI